MYQSLLQALESGATVVTANNRLARSLVAAYGRQQRALGKLAWHSPRIMSWSAWQQMLWEQSQLAGGQGAGCLCLSDTDSIVLWEEIARTDQDQLASGGGAGLARKAWKLLCDWQAVGAPEWSEAGLSPDQQMFIRWLGAYRNRLKTHDWVDGPMLPERLTVDAEQGLFDELGPLVFAGFDLWVPARTTLREALGRRGVTLTDTDAATMGNAGPARCEADNDRQELEQAARWARAQIEAEPEQEVCVVVRDLDARAAEARRVFMDVFCPDWRTRAGYALPVNFSYGLSLLEQPRVAAALNLLWLAQGDTDYQRFSLALRTPFLSGGRDEANTRAQLDLVLRDKLGAAFTLKDAAGFARSIAPEGAALLDTLVKARAGGERTLAEWAQWMTRVLQDAGWPGDDTLDSMAWQELEAWHQLLREFAASAKVRGATSLPAALGLLERLAGARMHQPEAGAGVIQVMGILEAAGHEFDRLWVCGMAAEDWPPPSNPHPLLPFKLQRRCSMPGSSPARELAYAETLTHRLSTSSAEVIFSWPGQRDGEALHPSGLIAPLALLEAPAVWMEPSWATGMLGSAELVALEDDQPLPWVPESQARGGAHLFRLQASCPLRAFLELRLGAGEVDAPVTGLSFKDRGSLAHNVLEDFYKRHRDSAALQALSVEALADELNELTARHIRALPGRGRPFMRTITDLETQRLLPLLMEFVALDRARDDFSVVQVEADEPHVVVGPLQLRLKLDRLDKLANGDLLVIDYKTGKVEKKDWNPARPGNMQLPLYAGFTGRDIKGIAFAQVSPHAVKYEGIAEESVVIEGVVTPAKSRTKLSDPAGNKLDEWDALLAEWQACLLRLADAFAAGDCSINPKHASDAEGQMAVLSRIHDLPATGDGEDFGEDYGDG